MPPSNVDRPPTVADTLTGILGAMRGEAGRTHVDEIERHNRRAADRRGGRADVLGSLLEQAKIEHRSFRALLNDRMVSLFPHYRDLRIRRSSRDFADRAPAIAGWSYDRVLRAVELAQDEPESTPPTTKSCLTSPNRPGPSAARCLSGSGG